MTLTHIELVLLALATMHIVEVYHHGSIFADLRARLQSSTSGFVRDLAGCMFCLSTWVGAVAIVLWTLEILWLRLLLCAFAVTRLANLMNDLSHPFNRTYDRKIDLPKETAPEEQS